MEKVVEPEEVGSGVIRGPVEFFETGGGVGGGWGDVIAKVELLHAVFAEGDGLDSCNTLRGVVSFFLVFFLLGGA